MMAACRRTFIRSLAHVDDGAIATIGATTSADATSSTGCAAKTTGGAAAGGAN